MVRCTMTEAATVQCTLQRPELEDLPLLFLDCPWTRGCGEQFLRERLWVLFGRGTLGRKIWGVGFLKFVAS